MHQNINVIIAQPDFSRTLQAYILPGLLDFLMLNQKFRSHFGPEKKQQFRFLFSYMPDLAEAFNILGILTHLGKSKLNAIIATGNSHVNRKFRILFLILWAYIVIPYM